MKEYWIFFYYLMLSEVIDVLNDFIIVQCIHVLKHHIVPDKSI